MGGLLSPHQPPGHHRNSVSDHQGVDPGKSCRVADRTPQAEVGFPKRRAAVFLQLGSGHGLIGAVDGGHPGVFGENRDRQTV
jgi:hypothetical protein